MAPDIPENDMDLMGWVGNLSFENSTRNVLFFFFDP